MNYYEQNDRRGRRWGVLFVLLYLLLGVGVMFLTNTIELPQPEMGIIVDFGTGDTGIGEFDLASGDVDVRPASPPRPDNSAEPLMMTDDPEAPEIMPEAEPRPAPPSPNEPQPVPERQPDRRALFPGRTEGSDAPSQGTVPREGNRGIPENAPQVPPRENESEGGEGTSGFSLAGRYLVGNLPRPAYNVEVEGRVVIRITVNPSGVVTGAVYEQAGSTTNHGVLVSAARAAALRARFTPEGDAEVQTGTITYIFRLN